jgi:WD40 repeat protein
MPQAPSVRKILCSNVSRDSDIRFSAQKCKLLFLDSGIGHEYEVDLLLKAIERNIPSEMIRLIVNMPADYLFPKLTRWLSRETNIGLEEAEWSVNSWAMAFGFIPFKESILQIPVEIFSTEAITPTARLEGHSQIVSALAFHPTATQLASASWDGTVRVWDLSTLLQHRILVPQQHGGISKKDGLVFFDVAFDATGGLIAAGDINGSIRIWSTQGGREAAELIGHLRSVHAVAFSRENHLLASASHDYSVFLWNLERPSVPLWSKELEHLVESIAISPNNRIVAVSTKGANIELLDMSSGEKVRTLVGHTSSVCDVTFNQDGSILASAGADQTVRLWNVESAQLLRVLRTEPLHQAASEVPSDDEDGNIMFTSVTISPDGKLIAAGGLDCAIRIWRLDTAEEMPIHQLIGHAAAVWDVAFSPDGQCLASAS